VTCPRCRRNLDLYWRITTIGDDSILPYLVCDDCAVVAQGPEYRKLKVERIKGDKA
jgi:hypothetical protein